MSGLESKPCVDDRGYCICGRRSKFPEWVSITVFRNVNRCSIQLVTIEVPIECLNHSELLMLMRDERFNLEPGGIGVKLAEKIKESCQEANKAIENGMYSPEQLKTL